METIWECLKEWAKTSFATEITEFSEKNSKVSVGSVAKPTELDTSSTRLLYARFHALLYYQPAAVS